MIKQINDHWIGPLNKIHITVMNSIYHTHDACICMNISQLKESIIHLGVQIKNKFKQNKSNDLSRGPLKKAHIKHVQLKK